MNHFSQNSETNSANSAKPTPNREPLPLADVWQTNLESVLLALVADGERRVSMELAAAPDAQGKIRLLVRRVADGAEQPSQIIDQVSHGPPPPHSNLVLTAPDPFAAIRRAIKP